MPNVTLNGSVSAEGREVSVTCNFLSVSALNKVTLNVCVP